MDWGRRFKGVRNLVKGKRVLCAYNAFLDSVVKVDVKQIAVLARGKEREVVSKSRRELGEIKNVEEFLAALVHGMRDGKAQHIACFNREVFEFFEEKFRGIRSIGGQAGIIANQLGLLGAKPVLYAPGFSRELAEKLSGNVRVPAPRGLVRALKGFEEERESKVNWIFEFRKGQELKVGGERFSAPRANRLIVASPPKALPCFRPDVAQLLPALGKNLDAAIFAGYHYLDEDAGGIGYKRVLGSELRNYKRLKSRNNKLVVHYEFVPMDHREMEHKVIALVAKGVDSLGLNEVELRRLLRVLGFAREAERIDEKEDAHSIVLGAKKLLHALKLKRIHVHNLGYFVLVHKKPVNAGRVVEACILASVAANSFAEKGAPVVERDLARGRHLCPSENGLRQLKQFAAEMGRKGFDAREVGERGFADLGKEVVFVVPAQIDPHPAKTVGLGDIVSSCALVGSL
jgi:ADP-dependent phosphofructokinase/glucokinase